MESKNRTLPIVAVVFVLIVVGLEIFDRGDEIGIRRLLLDDANDRAPHDHGIGEGRDRRSLLGCGDEQVGGSPNELLTLVGRRVAGDTRRVRRMRVVTIGTLDMACVDNRRLSRIVDELAARLGVEAKVMPMTDAPVRSRISARSNSATGCSRFTWRRTSSWIGHSGQV